MDHASLIFCFGKCRRNRFFDAGKTICTNNQIFFQIVAHHFPKGSFLWGIFFPCHKINLQTGKSILHQFEGLHKLLDTTFRIYINISVNFAYLPAICKAMRLLNLSADDYVYPNEYRNNSTYNQLLRLLTQCSKYQL